MAGVKAERQFANPGDEKKFAGSIKAIQSYGYALQNCSSPEITGDNAKVNCDTVLLKNKDTKPARTTFVLRREADHWQIVATE
jgi:hypothetical protein